MEDLIETDFDPAARELCSDGACIGVIGADGRCKECGTLSPTGPPKQAESTPSPLEEAPALKSEPEALPLAVPSGPEPEGFDPERRQLCSDGACIGLIGADGRCKECGKSAG